MAWNRKRTGDETVDLSSLLTGVTGTVWLTRSGKTRVLRLVDVAPTTLASGAAFLSLPVGDRPAYRIDEGVRTSTTSATVRSFFILTAGAVGIWAPSTGDIYRHTFTWGVA